MGSSNPAPAWQPLTFGGVARFARASFGRLLLVQFMVALFVALSATWIALTGWFPVIENALAELPDAGKIRQGQLHWTNASPARLAEGSFLAIRVDLDGDTRISQSADVQIELGRTALRTKFLLGHIDIPYPRGWVISLNRADALPWWGAWRPFLLIGIAGFVVVGLLTGWFLQSLIYSPAIRLIAFYSDRSANGFACVRLAGAAVLPGAVMMSGAMLLYSFHRLTLVGLLFAWLLHLVMGGIYAGVSTLCLTRLSVAPRRRSNPFGQSRSKKR